MIDALGYPFNSPASLKFHTCFNGASIAAVTGSGTNWQQALTINDAVTGYTNTDLANFLGSGLTIATLAAPNPPETFADSAEYATYFAAGIEANTDPSNLAGGQQLSTSCLARKGTPTANPQIDLTFTRAQAATVAAALSSVYTRSRVFIPAALNIISSQVNGFFYELDEFKTGWGKNTAGGALQSNTGDLRIKIELRGETGTPKYSVIVDNRGGAALDYTTDPNNPVATVNSDYYVSNLSDTVRFGTWHTIHRFYQRPLSPQDPTQGRLQVVIEPDGYDPIVGADIKPSDGIRLLGVNGLNINRFFMGMNYTSAPLPFACKLSNIQFWDRPPRVLI